MMKKYIAASGHITPQAEDATFSRINQSLMGILTDASTVQLEHEIERDEVYAVVTRIKNLCWEAQDELKKIDRFDLNPFK